VPASAIPPLDGDVLGEERQSGLRTALSWSPRIGALVLAYELPHA
jgi:hypothetical protein